MTDATEPPYEDDPGQMPLPKQPPWVQMIKIWEKVAFNGLPMGDRHSHRARFEGLWVACSVRDPANPLGVFERAAEAYCAAQKKRGKAPQLRWLASDFEQYASTYTSNGKRTSPLIEELERTQKLYDQAVSAHDAETVGRLDLELRRIGKRMSGHV